MTDTQLWLQITSGRGPSECQLAVAKLAERIVNEALKEKLKAETIELVPGREKGTALSALISLSGQGAGQFAKSWTGSILWICQSPFRTNHKRKNWFVGVETFSPVEEKEINIRPDELRIDVFRASGPGGQHVNTTDSAVRITHLPSGIAIVSKAERSQLMNKKLALAQLAAKLSELNEQKQDDAKQDQWKQHNNLTRGDAVRVFEGRKFVEK